VASTSFGGEEATGLAIVILVLMSIWLARKRAPALSFGLAWCCVALFPVSNVVIPTGILLAERTLFLPSVGFVLALGGGIAFVASRRPAVTQPARALIALAASVLVVAALGRSAQRQRVWQDPVTLTVASVQDAPRSWRVQQVYGEMLFSQGRAADAIAAFRRAIDLAPQSWRPRNNLAERLRMIGDDSDAVMLLRASLAEDPRQITTIAALAPALLGAGHYAEAKHLADSIVVAENAPPIMVQMSRLADSALKVNAPPGSIRIGIPTY
jgi:tetratricopeptide (TPR) repeat protein